MEQTVIQWIIEQTGTVGITALALFMLRAVYNERLTDRREMWDAQAAMIVRYDEIMRLNLVGIKEQTVASERQAAALRELTETLQRMLTQDSQRRKTERNRTKGEQT